LTALAALLTTLQAACPEGLLEHRMQHWLEHLLRHWLKHLL
jgi:hypothetical protein